MIRVADEHRGVKVGSEHGKWTAIGKPFMADKWRVVAECKCGMIAAKALDNLTDCSPKTTCKGCSFTTHKQSKTKLYFVWRGIINRCSFEGDIGYHKYGGRGIRVCSEWRESWERFRDWSHDNGYAEGLQIDRIDYNGNYEPSNCRWVTPIVNQRNKRNTYMVTAFGESKSLPDWVDDPRCVVVYDALYWRLTSGWNPEKAITVPSRTRTDR